MPYMLPLRNMQEAPPPQQSSKHHQMTRTVSISILVMSLPVLYVSILHVPPAALFRDTTFWFLMSNSIIIVIAADSGMLFFRTSSSSPRSSSFVDVDSNDGGLPFVDFSGGEPAAGVKNISVVDDEVAVPVEIVKNQVMVLSPEQENATAMVADNDDYSYALVLRHDRGELLPKEPECRDIMVVRPCSALAAGEAVPVVRNGGGGAMMVRGASRPAGLTASRSLAREERLLMRRHSHRPSSRALVPARDKSVVVASTTTTEEKQLRCTATDQGRPALEEKEKESEYSRLSDEELNQRVEEFITKFNREMRLQLEREQLALAAA